MTTKTTTKKTAKPATKAPVAKTAAKKPAAVAAAKKPAAAKAAPKAKPVATKAKVQKASGQTGSKKEKTIRDSFNMPAADYALIGSMKARALAGAREVKKSELLRAGLRLLAALGDDAFTAALNAVPSVKTGRPNKKHKN